MKIYAHKEEENVYVYAENYAPIAYSVIISYDLENLNTSSGLYDQTYLIPANTTDYLLEQFDVVNPSFKYSYSYKYDYKIGNILAKHDDTYEYHLPILLDSVQISQGYLNPHSHKEKYAIDFKVPIGTPVYAARGGVIANVINEHEKHCFRKKCAKFNNKVVVYHNDGSFANYSHLKKKGTVVRKGQKVKVGDLLGYSGNTGYSSGPHLHFEIYINQIKNAISIPTRFRVNGGRQVLCLEEKKYYKP